MNSPDSMRLDKWLWCARFYKTRSLATEEITKGRVTVNGQPAKPGKEVRVGDRIDIRTGYVTRTVEVLALSGVRGPAPVAALLYRETTESVAARAMAVEQRRLAPEPALSLNQGRPSKKDRRSIERLRQPSGGQWNERWSASLDD